MRKPRNEFHEAVQKGLKCAEKLVSDFEILNSMCESGQDIEAFQYSFGVHGRVCKLFKISNYLPAFTGDSEADKLVEEVLREEKATPYHPGSGLSEFSVQSSWGGSPV